MEGENLIQDLTWLDDAIAKDYVDELEAACCLTEGQAEVYFGDKVSSAFVDYQVHPNLRRNYNTITTWNRNLSRYNLLWFIDKSLVKNLQNFRRKILLEKCKTHYLNLIDEAQEQFRTAYYYISRELGLIIKKTQGPAVNEPPQSSQNKAISENGEMLTPKIESLLNGKTEEKIQEASQTQPQNSTSVVPKWIIEARIIADKVALKKWKSGVQEITARGICDEVAKELGKNRKYWGRKGPRTGMNIRKFALKGWQFNPPKGKK